MLWRIQLICIKVKNSLHTQLIIINCIRQTKSESKIYISSEILAVTVCFQCACSTILKNVSLSQGIRHLLDKSKIGW